ncbi:MAG: carbamate kinase [Planctomycetes bacterium]|nr:carbamate kinase [Planctomycetota bacterium]NOG55966.1 carbamate kinase [Planctomycetota bacterium]
MNTPSGPVVIALGGNAISPEGEEGNIPQQYERTRRTVVQLADLIQTGFQLVITHGNGPQVGNVLRRVELAAAEIYPLPLDTCVADTQGGMGYMIAQCLTNELAHRSVDRTVGTVVTSVEVDANDPAFDYPAKPIGNWYNPSRGNELIARHGWQMIEHPVRGMRRVVPSPAPQRIVELDLIRMLVEQQQTIVAAGGGGIPVAHRPGVGLVGCEAVIDKDLTSALLATRLGAAVFVIVTSVNRVSINFDTPDQHELDSLTVAQARDYLQQGHFPPGSMGPKIEASIKFLAESQRDDARVIICGMDAISEALAGKSGTVIEP